MEHKTVLKQCPNSNRFQITPNQKVKNRSKSLISEAFKHATEKLKVTGKLIHSTST